MSPLLIITAAVWCGFCVRRLGCYMSKRTSSCKESGCYMINHTNSGKVDDTTDNNVEKLDVEIPISLNHEDCLTKLPDEVLSYILTYLTLRDVLRMTTLSKRWKNILSYMPKLDLDWQVITRRKGAHETMCKIYRRAYVKRVNKVLQDCENQDISSFHISFCFDKDIVSHVDHWISFASKKRLESLTLQFICLHDYASILELKIQKRLSPEFMYTVTSSFLSHFPCLKDLRLEVCILKLHSDFRLNKLVRLDLYYVVLEGNQLQWMLSNCSNIEWLRIRWCNLPEKLAIGDNLQRLNSLMIHDRSGMREIELNSKSLKFFEYVGDPDVKLSFLSAPKLESSNLVLVKRNNKAAERIIRDLATFLPSLETLFLQGMHYLVHLIPTHPSTLFRHVVHLRLDFGDEDPEVDLVKSFPRLLNSFPRLQKLYLTVPYSRYPRSHRTYELPDVCLNNSLKEIELGNFYMDWIPCASYFLKSAVMLDRMLISSYINRYTREGEWEESLGCFSQQECDYIRLSLQGNAISPNVNLVISRVAKSSSGSCKDGDKDLPN